MFRALFLFLGLLVWTAGLAASPLILRDNLRLAKPGDYIVAAQGKCYTVLHIQAKTPTALTIEETTVPVAQAKRYVGNWKNWVESGAPGHTSWVAYEIDLENGEMLYNYSYTRNEWCQIPQGENFLSALLNLPLYRIPYEQRKRVGPPLPRGYPDKRMLWQPRMVIDGQEVSGVDFEAYKTYWPKDGSEMSGKAIEIFLPENSALYPGYFPYWLQISGMVGKARVRIIDSGTKLLSPKAKINLNQPKQSF